MDLEQFLRWLVASGGSIMAVSWLLERLAWFQTLTPDHKDYTIFGASVVVGCGALAAINYIPESAVVAVAPYFLVVASIFTTVFVAKSFHRVDAPQVQPVALVEQTLEDSPEPSGRFGLE